MLNSVFAILIFSLSSFAFYGSNNYAVLLILILNTTNTLHDEHSQQIRENSLHEKKKKIPQNIHIYIIHKKKKKNALPSKIHEKPRVTLFHILQYLTNFHGGFIPKLRVGERTFFPSWAWEEEDEHQVRGKASTCEFDKQVWCQRWRERNKREQVS